MFCHFWQKFENSKWPPFLGRGKFFENCKEYISLDTLWVENFRRNRSITHGLGNMSTFALFSIQNSQLLIYLINYSLIYETITPKSNPIQAINPMNLRTKFQKARLNSIP